MSRQCIAACADWLRENTRLPAEQRTSLAGLGPDLVSHLRGPRNGKPLVIGIAGAPGTGKSTLASMLTSALASEGRTAMTLSLDDYYLPKANREQRAQQIHELFLRRGVPGTHDTGLLLEHIDALRSGFSGRMMLPRFNKSEDERMSLPAIVTAPTDLEVVFVEGWFIGAPPQGPDALESGINPLEQEQDEDGRWRRAVDEYLADIHTALKPRLDFRWYLRDPGWSAVLNWRWHQECDLPEERRRLADEAAVNDFLAPFQRLCDHLRHASWADLVVALDEQHRPEIAETA